jgi:hypothetical protein
MTVYGLAGLLIGLWARRFASKTLLAASYMLIVFWFLMPEWCGETLAPHFSICGWPLATMPWSFPIR